LTAHRQTRTYAAQWISVGEIQKHLGAERRRLKTAGEPVHSISLVYGWARTDLDRQPSAACRRMRRPDFSNKGGRAL
jgi:hypothetical protein